MEENRELWSFIGKFNLKNIIEYNKKKKFAVCFENESINQLAKKLQQELKTKNVNWEIYQCISSVKRSLKWFSERNEVFGRENIITESNGTVRYKLNGQLHRKNGPAVEYANGNKEWYIEGKLHRIDGPAIECANGFKEYYVYGIEVRKLLKYGFDYIFTVLKQTEKSLLIFPGASGFSSKQKSFWIPQDPQFPWQSDLSIDFIVIDENEKEIKVMLQNKVTTFNIPGKYDLRKIHIDD